MTRQSHLKNDETMVIATAFMRNITGKCCSEALNEVVSSLVWLFFSFATRPPHVLLSLVRLTGVRRVPERQALPSALHLPQKEPQEEDHGEREGDVERG